MASEPTENFDEFEEPPVPTSQSAAEKGVVSRALYVAGYVFHAIRRNKRRSISLLIGIMIGATLVTSIFVWTDTGGRVAIDDYFSNTPFHYYCIQNPHFPNDDPNAIYPVRDYVNRLDTTKETFIVHSSIALFEIGDLRPNDYYLPWPYGRGIKDCQTFLTDNEFLARIERSFTILEGVFRLAPGNILLSRRVVEDLEAVMGLQVGVGSIIDVAIARNYHYADQIGEINPTYLNGLRVAGIYEVILTLDPLIEAFPSQSRVNWGPVGGQEVIFGWTDSMIMSASELQPNDLILISQWVMYPRLLVKVDPIPFYAVGIDQTVLLLDRVFTRVEEAFDIFLGGRDTLMRLTDYINSYHERRTMGVLVLPMVILSFLSTTFTTTLFISGRRPEIAILRSRGASYRQLYATLLFEFVVLSISGLVLGGFLGLLIGCLLPSASSFLIFDTTIFLHYLSLAKLEPLAWVIAGLAAILPAGIYTLFVTRSFLQTELYAAIRGNGSRWKVSPWIEVLYIIVVVLIFWPLLTVLVSLPLSTDIALFAFILAIGFWVLLSDAIARIIKPGIAGFSKIFHPVFGQKSHLFATSVRVRRTRIVPLLIILLLTFSVTIFSAVQAQTYQGHVNRQIEYYIGGDIRIYSGAVPVSRIDDIITLPQIETATGFIELRADVYNTDYEFRLLGIDPAAYAIAGNWDSSSMIGDNWQVVLNRLANDVNGTIFPAHLAELLGKTVGDTVRIRAWDQLLQKHEFKTLNIVGLCRTAPGFGYSNPSDPAASVSARPGFGFQKGQPFAFCHEHLMLVELPAREPSPYQYDRTQLFLAKPREGTSVLNALTAVQSVDFAQRVWSPITFDLKTEYADGYIFYQGIVSLLSVGFLASLAISVVALTVFVNTIVQERKIEYAIMRALGGTRSQVTAIVLGEFVGLIMAAFLFSLIMGSVFSQILLPTILQLFPQPYILPSITIYPISLLAAVLGLVVLGLVTGAYLPARRAGKVEVNRILRNL
ncbi:MAG: ABC transporter permease [Promethearchaeota archaeon]